MIEYYRILNFIHNPRYQDNYDDVLVEIPDGYVPLMIKTIGLVGVSNTQFPTLETRIIDFPYLSTTRWTYYVDDIEKITKREHDRCVIALMERSLKK